MPPSRSLLYVRSGAFAVAALALSVPFLVFVPLALLPVRFGWPFVTAYLRGLLFLLKHICGLGYAVRGVERLRGGPVLIASAHQTTWETVFFPILFGNPSMVIKEKIFRYPLVGTIARKNGYIAAHRSGDLDEIRQSLAAARRLSEAGRNILIFPAGTRTGPDPDPALRRGVAALYEQLGVPCIPVALNSSRFWQFRSWLRHEGTIMVDILEPIAPGLDKKTFLDTFERRLRDGTTRLMTSADRPVLMPNPSATALKFFSSMRSGRGSESG